MNESNLTEKLNQIRHKLNKYSSLKDNLKIKSYLNELNNVENINLEILKETQIVDCLKALKKNNDPEYSQKAGSIISKWRTFITNNNEKEEAVKKETKVNTNVNHNSNNDNNNSNLKNGVKMEKKELPSSANSNVSRSSDLNKKRSSSDLLNESLSKKPKINLNDYKVKSEFKEENYEDREEMYKKLIESSSSKPVNKPVEKPSMKLPIVPLPTMPLKDLFSDTAISSPVISFNTPNYQSIASNILDNRNGYQSMNSQNDDDALAKIFKTRQSKKTLYTGKKTDSTNFQVPSLFKLATDVLIKTIDDLPYRVANYNSRNKFPLAYDVVKGVMEKANAKQLQAIEYYSPHFLEDTDSLWKKLCEHEFKKIDPPDDDETWRELYFRQVDEREEKFRRARDLISKKQAEKPKDRVTQIATVRFVANTSKSSSMSYSSSSASGKMKALNSSSGPIRQIVHDSPVKRAPVAAIGGGKKPVGTAPAMSQGMKATMKLIKKTTRR